MSRFQDVYEVKVQTDQKELNRLQMKFQSLQRTMNNTSDARTFTKTQNEAGQVSKQIQSQNQALQRSMILTNGIGRAWEQSKMGVLGFNGTLLSTLFFGMAIKNAFMSAFSAMMDSYKKLIPENSKFNKETTKLSANWEFFKFQLADALANSKVFDVFIDKSIQLLNWFKQLPQPVKTFVAVLIPVGIVLGTILMLTGLIGLGIAGLVDGALALKTALAPIPTSFKAIGGAVSSINPVKLAILGAAAAVGVLVWQMNKFHNSSDLGKKKQKQLAETWKNTVNSALNPLSKAFAGVNLNIKSMTEFGIILGVTMHNFLTILGMVIDLVIYLGRTFSNLIEAAIQPLITSIKGLAKIMWKFADGDFKGAWEVAKDTSADVKSDLIKDFKDIGDAADNFMKNRGDKFDALAGYKPALEEFRKAQKEMSSAEGNLKVTTEKFQGQKGKQQLIERIQAEVKARNEETSKGFKLPQKQNIDNSQNIYVSFDESGVPMAVSEMGSTGKEIFNNMLEEAGVKPSELGNNLS